MDNNTYNIAIDDVIDFVAKRYSMLMATGVEKAFPEGWALVSVELYDLIHIYLPEMKKENDNARENI